MCALDYPWSAAVWGLGDPTAKRKPSLVFVRDAVVLGVYFASFCSNTAEWRGVRYRFKGPYMESVDVAHGNTAVRHV
jgi:hypothetical protein